MIVLLLIIIAYVLLFGSEKNKRRYWCINR